MILYLLKSAGCLIILLLVHRLLLQREAIYQFNRFYLLSAVIGSFLIPLVEIEVPAKPASVPQQLVHEPDFSAYFEAIPFEEMENTPVFQAVEAEQKPDRSLILGIGYGLITLIFFIRFVRNISLLVDKINKNPHVRYRGETLILLKTESLPFSFLSYIFVSKGYFENNQLTDAIFAHEQAHVRGRHTWDNLLIEALLVPFWFHPGLYLARQAIKLNHEFIADEAALQVTPLDQYKTFLLAMMSPRQSAGLASSLNFSLTKKRFEMMKRKTANSTKWVKILFVLPIFAVLVYFLSEKVTAKGDESQNSESGEVQPYQENNEITIFLRANDKLEVDGQIIAIEELAELIKSKNPENTLVRFSAAPGVEMGFVGDVQENLRENNIRMVDYEGRLNHKTDEEKVYTIVSDSPFQSLTKAEYYSQTRFFIKYPDGELEEFSYSELPENYKKGLHNPPGEVSKKVPSSELFESWKNKNDFALWLDGKVVPNSKLDDFKVGDITYYSSSFVHKNARSERFPQNYQVQIYTLSGFENTYGKNSNFGKKPIGGSVTINSENSKNDGLTSSGYSDFKNYIVTSSSYQKQLVEFKIRTNENRLFSQPSEQEIAELQQLYNSLQVNYLNLSIEERRKMKRATFPYAKIERAGGIIYKRFEDLTPEERKELGC
jgi:biopolymer transport protein ExbD